MKKTIIILITILSCNLSFSQENSEYSKELLHMFEVSGTEESYKAAIKQIMGMYREQYTGLGQELWDELESEFMKTSLDDLTKMLTPIYQKYLSIDDLKGIIKFYESPVGLNYAEHTPMIMQESMQVGQQWGAKISEQLMERIKAEE